MCVGGGGKEEEGLHQIVNVPQNSMEKEVTRGCPMDWTLM